MEKGDEVQQYLASFEEDESDLVTSAKGLKNSLLHDTQDLNIIVTNVINGDSRELQPEQVDHFQEEEDDAFYDLQKTHIKVLKENCVYITDPTAKKFANLWIVNSNVYPLNHKASPQVGMDQNVMSIHPLSYTEILTPTHGDGKPHRIIVTKGMAGIGKTVCVEKLIHDWAAGSTLSEFDFMFLFSFCKLNMLSERSLSLVQLLQHYYPHMKNCEKILISKSVKSLYIFDGLDESIQGLDFENQLACYDENALISLGSLLTNLIRGNLHSSASVWITTRPAAIEQIPLCYIDRLTEIKGFCEQQKKEFFHKKYENRHLAEKMIAIVNKEQRLSPLCDMPIFCSVLSVILEDALESFQNCGLGDYAPVAITSVFTKFLVYAFSHQQQKCEYLTPKKQTIDALLESKQKAIFNLGKLAFDLLRGQTQTFYEKDLKLYNVDTSLAESGFCKEIVVGNASPSNKAFCFVDRSLQEYFAALYVFLSLNNNKDNALNTVANPKTLRKREKSTYSQVCKQAYKEAIKSSCGHFDLFLRFLCGLGTKQNQQMLKGLMTSCEMNHDDITKIVQIFKKKLQEDIPPEKCITILQCLSELEDYSLVKETRKFVAAGAVTSRTLMPAEYSALAFVLQMSYGDVETLDLSQHKISSVGLQRLVPVLHLFTSLKMIGSNLGDSGVKILSQMMASPDCKLQNLELEKNDLTHKCCETLAFILSSSRMLSNLNLSNNSLGDRGIRILSNALKAAQCRVQKLNLSNNNLSTGSWEEIVSVLITNQTLRELNVSNNRMGETGLRTLSTALKDPRCKLEKLGLNNTCTLDFGMMGSYQEEAGMEILSDVLKDPRCKLKSLELAKNCLTQRNYEEIASAMRVNCSLTRLDLSSNVIQDSGINVISMALMDTSCSIQSLVLTETKLTPTCCEKLASVLVTNQTLRELDLSMNKLGDSGICVLSTALKEPSCKLETLGLKQTCLTDACCEKLITALSTSQTMARLDLSENLFTDSSIKNFCSLILTCTNLECLMLEQNQFTTNGQMAIKKLSMKKPGVRIVIERG
ncbi:NLR family CARD domain-containing protein 3-like isoform X1 [Stegostoma tigrinum]|uniref:NLR family CARD domain-containing protein 3-like isoform X1 n=1 Tax=Stegostoma tigrinum TaxID=3053191 RepID=UPI002870AA9E|nr:NLR family CARD domain-containing protein 3-like isoform X1 [Stegostoma tigrinum]XP_048398545.2 NLR family CARD domain-containing protein 3-like isoform X1 [Stegostoma tigrinum]XP_048398546.2 NLR family CARD domain-containing protein 3-like isoform X1 [Stegostoma tigrinum]